MSQLAAPESVPTGNATGRGFKALLGLAMTSMAIGAFAPEAEATTAYSTLANTDGEISQELSYDPQTGDTMCHVRQFSYDSFLGSQSLVTQVQTYRKGRWSADSRFRQPFAVSGPQADSHLADTALDTVYNAGSLQRIARFSPARLACLSGQTSIFLPVPREEPPRSHNPALVRGATLG